MDKALGPLGIGIIGYGGFGQFLHQCWAGMEEVEVRAVADADSELGTAVATNARGFVETNAALAAGPAWSHRDRKREVTFYGDWRELLDNRDVDIISIATPPFTHADLACGAMRAGKHVLIEKPLATTRDDALRIRAVADETHRIAAVDYMLRFNPIVEAIQSWARDGAFGVLRRVVAENYAQDESLSRDHWFWDRAKSGGILVEHAVHFIDVVNGCTDAEPVFVDGLMLDRGDGRIDRMGLTAIYDDGLVTQQYHAFSRPGFFEETGMRFVFDLATVDVEGWIPLCGRATVLTNRDTVDALERMPGFNIHERTPLADIDDTSRPAGWGAASDGGATEADEAGVRRSRDLARRQIYSGGVHYEVTEQIRAEFALPLSKSAAYADALRAMMADVVAAVRDPTHQVRADVREGLRSLDIALAATERAFLR